MKSVKKLWACVLMILATLFVFNITASADNAAAGLLVSLTGTPATGDGRIYAALAVFAAAIIVAVIMILFGKKNKD